VRRQFGAECGPGTNAGENSADASSVDRFVTLATAGLDVDCEPLASPKDAIAKGDLVVSGTLVDVVDGIQLRFPDPAYTLVVLTFATVRMSTPAVMSSVAE